MASVGAHLLGTLQMISTSDQSALCRVQLIEEHRVAFGVNKILGPSLDTAVGTGLLEVVIEPTHEDIFRSQLQQGSQVLTIIEEKDKLRVVLDRNLAQQLHADNLPHESQNQDRTTLDEILCTNVDNLATDTLGSVQGKIQILSLGVDIELSLAVKRTNINGVGNSQVDQSAKHGQSKVYISP